VLTSISPSRFQEVGPGGLTSELPLLFRLKEML